ncbi:MULTISPECIES: hypothetical protein [unclassified Kitasatospora]|uniref:hypothetical protein n=1 Tax=unclassified Kitasatospora TaxID=2633591 RepID=UPI001ADFCF65|nr:hypothetical protein [Kitasatospora sp. RG8]MBP0451165.1 hypothetical protein [Kitasatospora sp. RG8]
MRTPVFELHIQPMFRAIDREHMTFAVDLWDYDSVVANADEILSRVDGGGMPPDGSGGPWPEEWVAVFRRWNESGHKRLQLGTATFAFSHSGTTNNVTATGTFPAAGFTGWLQLENETDSAKTYVLYYEAPDAPVPGVPAAFTLKERYRDTDARSVFVRDNTGVQQLH